MTDAEGLRGEDIKRAIAEATSLINPRLSEVEWDDVAEALDRASAEELREALEGLDAPFQWLQDNYPKAMREMPTHLIRKFDAARAALRDTGPRPDNGIDVERLARALDLNGVNWPKRWGDNDFAWLARQVAAEYARLSTPRTETSETADTVRIGSKTYLAGSDDD